MHEDHSRAYRTLYKINFHEWYSAAASLRIYAAQSGDMVPLTSLLTLNMFEVVLKMTAYDAIPSPDYLFQKGRTW